jgi:hypothetical protein
MMPLPKDSNSNDPEITYSTASVVREQTPRFEYAGSSGVGGPAVLFSTFAIPYLVKQYT